MGAAARGGFSMGHGGKGLRAPSGLAKPKATQAGFYPDVLDSELPASLAEKATVVKSFVHSTGTQSWKLIDKVFVADECRWGLQGIK